MIVRLYRTLCILTVACLICAAAARTAFSAPPHKPAEKPAVPRTGRDVQAIGGEWKFLTDPDDMGEKRGWDHTIPPDATSVTVPSTWSKQNAPRYLGAAWYWREFDVPAKWQGQTVRLRFEGAAERAKVWLNGQLLGEHTGGAVPFDFNATRSLHIGNRNMLAVRLEGNAALGAGLWQNVLLLAQDEAYIADCFPQADDHGDITSLVYFLNTSAHEGDAMLDARLVAQDAPTRTLTQTYQILHLTPGSNQTTLLLSPRKRSLHLWSPESPSLYLLQLVFRQDKDILDNLEAPLGFRSWGLHDDVVTLNDAPIKLNARVPAAFAPPVVIATPDDEANARRFLQGLKAEGVSVIYLAAPPPILLHLADEVGMLVVERVLPGETGQTRADEIRGLLLRDRAHPCVMAWDLGEVSEEEARLLRGLDPTRFLLVGPEDSPHLWLPNQSAPSSAALPAGLLPTP